MSTAKLEIWPAVGKNFRSLGESFYSSIIRYPWMLAIGAFAGYLLGEVRMYGSQNAMNMYWILTLATLILLAFIGCRHSHEVITRDKQAYPSVGRGLKYFIFGLILIVVITGVALAGSVIGFIGVSGEFGGGVTIWTLLIGVSWIVAIYLSSRVILVLPAIAVGNSQTGFKRSWELTKGSEWRVIAILLITYIIMAFIMAIPDMLSEFLLGGDMLGILLGGSILWWTQLVTTLFMAEVTARIFVFFLKPDMYPEYLN